MKKIVFSSVLVFSILNAKTLETENDFLNWSPIPSNINPKLAETVNLNYWRDKITDNQIISNFETAVAKIPTAKANLQKTYDEIYKTENDFSKPKSDYDNLKKLLNKIKLNTNNGLNFSDITYDNWDTFFDTTLKNTITNESIKKNDSYIDKIGRELHNDVGLAVEVLMWEKLLNDELSKEVLNFSDDENKIIEQIKDIPLNSQDNVEQIMNALRGNEKLRYYDYLFSSIMYRINNIDNETIKNITVSTLITKGGVDQIIKDNPTIQTVLDLQEWKDYFDYRLLMDLRSNAKIYLKKSEELIKPLESQADGYKSTIQDAETAREALEQAIKATKEFNNLMDLNTFLQNNPLADGVDSSDIAELYDDTKTLEHDKDFKDQNPQTRQKVQAKADTFATKVLENKKSEVMTNATAPTLVQLNNMTKRLGELRDLNARYGAWLRSYGGQMSADSKHIHYYSIQLGADKVNRLKNDKLIIGFLAGFDKINGYIDSQTYSVGGYVSYLHSSGVFSDMVAKYTHTKHEKSGHEFDKQHSFLASFESGYRFGFGYEFYVEQSLEFITGYIGKYQDKVGTSSISIDAYTPFIIKPQAHIGGMVGGFSYRLGVGGVLNTAEQEAKISLNMDEISKGLKANGKTSLDKNNHGFVSLGGAYKVGKKSRISLSAERSFGGKIVNDYEINATIRVGF